MGDRAVLLAKLREADEKISSLESTLNTKSKDADARKRPLGKGEFDHSGALRDKGGRDVRENVVVSGHKRPRPADVGINTRVAKGTADKDNEAKPASNRTETDDRAAHGAEKRPKVQLDEGTAQRSRRMFGALLGHLTKAKTILESEPEQKRISTQLQQQAAAAEHDEARRKREAEEHEAAIAQAKELALQTKREALIEKETAALELMKLDMLAFLKGQQASGESYFVTEAYPPICWKPAEWNHSLQKQCQEQAAALQLTITRRMEQVHSWSSEKQAEVRRKHSRHSSEKSAGDKEASPEAAIAKATSTAANVKDGEGSHEADIAVVEDVVQPSTTESATANVQETVAAKPAEPFSESADDLLDYGHD